MELLFQVLSLYLLQTNDWGLSKRTAKGFTPGAVGREWLHTKWGAILRQSQMLASLKENKLFPPSELFLVSARWSLAADLRIADNKMQ